MPRRKILRLHLAKMCQARMNYREKCKQFVIKSPLAGVYSELRLV